MQGVAEARALLEAAVAADPDYALARLNLGKLLARAGEREAAIGHLEKYLSLGATGKSRSRVELMVMRLKAQRD